MKQIIIHNEIPVNHYKSPQNRHATLKDKKNSELCWYEMKKGFDIYCLPKTIIWKSLNNNVMMKIFWSISRFVIYACSYPSYQPHYLISYGHWQPQEHLTSEVLLRASSRKRNTDKIPQANPWCVFFVFATRIISVNIFWILKFICLCIDFRWLKAFGFHVFINFLVQKIIITWAQVPSALKIFSCSKINFIS